MADMSEEEFENFLKQVGENTSLMCDYAIECGRLARRMGLDADACPWDERNFLSDGWHFGYAQAAEYGATDNFIPTWARRN